MDDPTIKVGTCPSCGFPAMPGEGFCRNCGQSVLRPTAAGPSTPPPGPTVAAPPPASLPPTIAAPPPAVPPLYATRTQPPPRKRRRPLLMGCLVILGLL